MPFQVAVKLGLQHSQLRRSSEAVGEREALAHELLVRLTAKDDGLEHHPGVPTAPGTGKERGRERRARARLSDTSPGPHHKATV